MNGATTDGPEQRDTDGVQIPEVQLSNGRFE